MTLNEIKKRIDNAPELEFGNIFNESMDLFKKVWLQGLITLVITIALMVPFYIIIYLPMIALGVIDQQNLESGLEYGYEPSIALMVPFFLIMLVFMFFAMFISFAMKAAFYRICREKDLGTAGKDDYFYFFKKIYIGKILKLALASLGISLIATLLCALPLLYVIVPISYFTIVLAFHPEKSASEIIKISFWIGNKKWLLSFGLLIIASILAQIVGLIMCVVGVFVTASFAYLPLYFIYKHVVGFEEGKEINYIGSEIP